ncbi:MAG: hypothetical protein IPQ16_09855 [Geobacteraceae bacterium]|nr:hypothetical protein [Geobacteraceae bacterium]
MSASESNPPDIRLQPLTPVRVVGNILAFIIPCAMFVEVNVIGRLFVPEIILLILLPLLVYFRSKWLLRPVARKMIIFVLLWLSAQIFTDLVREIPFVDWSRGWAKIVFFLLNFISLYLLLSRRKIRITLFCAGIVVGQILSFFISPDDYAIEYPWKFGLGYPVTTTFVLLSQTNVVKRIKYGTEFLISLAAAINLLLGFRSLALICVGTVAYIVFNKRSLRRGTAAATLSKWAMVNLAILLLGAGFATIQAYKYAAEMELLSEKNTKKYLQQESGQYGTLLSSRPELLASSLAIFDSPVIGHGSWAKDPKYNLTIAYLMADLGYKNPQTYVRKGDEGLIPTHSHLFGAWVESGVVGALFWGWVWLLALKALWKLHNVRESLMPLAAFVCLNILWNVLFSPFGAEGRVYMAYYIVLIFFVLSRAGVVSQPKEMKST